MKSSQKQKTSSQWSVTVVGNNALISSLILVIVVQWALFTSILIHRHHGHNAPSQRPNAGGQLLSRNSPKRGVVDPSIGDDDDVPSSSPKKPVVYAGVAATLMLDAPRWFQRRYSFIVSNALVNIPPDWAVQIFHTGSGQSRVGMEINPGLARLAGENERIILTEIPEEMWRKKGTRKKILYWTDEWMWKAMAADRVLVFGGNGAICSNSKMSLVDDGGDDSSDAAANKFLLDLDYVGCPWRNQWGRGGDGTVSYRNRTAMIEAIRHVPHNGSEREDSYFVKTLLDMNNKVGTSYRVASKEQTEVFCGTRDFNETVGPPMVISGTLPNLDHDVREAVLAHCPELKVIFPSLHNPACFGASPDGEECARHICALAPPETRRGGC